PDLAGAARFVGLEGAAGHLDWRALGRPDRGYAGAPHQLITAASGELVLQSLVLEVSLLLGHPFLQATVGHDPELRHRLLLAFQGILRAGGDAGATGGWGLCFGC